MNEMTIKDTNTGKEITVAQQAPGATFIVLERGCPTVEVMPRSIGKVIKTWVKERMKERKCPVA